MDIDKSKYKFFVLKDNTIIAVTSFMGQTIKGIAKCHPDDTFDIEIGKELALARCYKKVAKKRRNKAAKEWRKLHDEYQKAYYRYQKAGSYYTDAALAEKTAETKIEELIRELKDFDTFEEDM